MAGPYLNDCQIIKTWLSKTYSEGRYLQFDDLHIDQISPNYKKKDSWLQGGVTCLKAATDLCKDLKLPCIIVLIISLRSNKKSYGVNFSNLSELEKEFCQTPPSLYMFDKTNHSWYGEDNRPIEIEFLNSNLGNSKCFYLEYKLASEEEYRRFLWLEIN